jgi:hypothetical protein
VETDETGLAMKLCLRYKKLSQDLLRFQDAKLFGCFLLTLASIFYSLGCQISAITVYRKAERVFK